MVKVIAKIEKTEQGRIQVVITADSFVITDETFESVDWIEDDGLLVVTDKDVTLFFNCHGVELDKNVVWTTTVNEDGNTVCTIGC